MSSSLPDGFTARAATEDDVEPVAELLHTAEAALRGHSSADAAALRQWWRLLDLPQDTRVVFDESRLVASCALFRQDETGQFTGVVHPDYNDRGLGTWLLDFAEERARAHEITALRVGTAVENERAAQLFAEREHREVRHYFEMRIDLDERPEPPVWPDGIRPDTFRLDDARAFHSALNEAFADEFGWISMDFDEWKRFRLDAPDFDPSLWFVARDGGDLAAVARCERMFGGGYVGAIGVRPAWRRRGLGLALLRYAFGEFHARGEPHVKLGVDAENPTGATRLYERAGMRVESEDVVYEKELA